MTRAQSLHIGLNSVNPRHYAGWSGELMACEADARDMAAIAKAARIAPHVLLTRKATRAAVLGALRRAAATLRKGDLFVVSYAGHGGQLPDAEGDEPDAMDETWCLYDGELIDDELAHCWAQFRAGVRILVFSDSCHSGTVTRGAAFRAVRTGDLAGLAAAERRAGKRRAGRARAMPMKAALLTYLAHRTFYDRLGRAPRKRESDVKATVILISGCQDNQESSDGAFNGLFTGTLRRVWNRGAFRGDYRGFHRAIVKRMPRRQRPNYYRIGAASRAFESQKPFTI